MVKEVNPGDNVQGVNVVEDSQVDSDRELSTEESTPANRKRFVH